MVNSPEPALIVFAWGNESRGDDGIGPEFARRLRKLHLEQIEVIEDHQLNIEHVTDFSGDTPLLFVDASVAVGTGIRLSRIEPSEDGNFSTHAISPQALLNVYEKTSAQSHPPAFLLHVAAREFDLGEGLGQVAAEALDDADEFIAKILANPPPEWTARLEAASV